MGSLRVRVAGGYVLECLRHLPNPPRMTSWCGVGFFNRSFGRVLLELSTRRSPPPYIPPLIYRQKIDPAPANGTGSISMLYVLNV